MKKIENYFDKDKMVAGTAKIVIVLNEPWDVDFMEPKNCEITHMAPYNDKEPDEVMKTMYDDFKQATLGLEMSSKCCLGMCMIKVSFNEFCNIICLMFEINMGQFGEYQDVEAMARQLFNEAHGSWARVSIKMIDNLQQIQSVLDSCIKLKFHYPSMYQEFSKGRNTEVDYINGYIVKVGRKNNYVCRIHEFVTHQVHLSEQMRKYNQH